MASRILRVKGTACDVVFFFQEMKRQQSRLLLFLLLKKGACRSCSRAHDCIRQLRLLSCGLKRYAAWLVIQILISFNRSLAILCTRLPLKGRSFTFTFWHAADIPERGEVTALGASYSTSQPQCFRVSRINKESRARREGAKRAAPITGVFFLFFLFLSDEFAKVAFQKKKKYSHRRGMSHL